MLTVLKDIVEELPSDPGDKTFIVLKYLRCRHRTNPQTVLDDVYVYWWCWRDTALQMCSNRLERDVQIIGVTRSLSLVLQSEPGSALEFCRQTRPNVYTTAENALRKLVYETEPTGFSRPCRHRQLLQQPHPSTRQTIVYAAPSDTNIVAPSRMSTIFARFSHLTEPLASVAFGRLSVN